MTVQAKPGRPLFSRHGGWLVEAALVLALLAVMASGIVCCARGQMKAAMARRTLIEMGSILEAAQAYHYIYGIWPVDLKETAGQLGTPPGKNAWGNTYRFSSVEGSAQVATTVPNGVDLPEGPWAGISVTTVSSGRIWRMAVPLSYGLTARLEYEKDQK